MIKRVTVAMLALLWAVQPAIASVEHAQIFIHGMLGGVEALEIRCPDEILEITQSRQMEVVCAKFDGDFELFESRWSRQMPGDASSGRRDLLGRLPLVQARTAWKLNGAVYERIYSVGRTVVGIRFTQGVILMVYPTQ